jgi:thioredoxin-like negative regulator of GroEL
LGITPWVTPSYLPKKRRRPAKIWSLKQSNCWAVLSGRRKRSAVIMDIEINKDNYQEEIVENPTPTVVDFWGPQCVRCLELMPVIEEIALSKKDAMRLVKIDATKTTKLT